MLGHDHTIRDELGCDFDRRRQEASAVPPQVDNQTFGILCHKLAQRTPEFVGRRLAECEEANIPDLAFQNPALRAGYRDIRTDNLEFQRFDQALPKDSQDDLRSGWTHDLADHQGAVDAGHIFAVDGDNNISRFEPGQLGWRSGHRRDDCQVCALRVDPGSDPLIAPFEGDVGLTVNIRIHVRALVVAEGIDHPLNCSSDEFGVVQRLVDELLVDDRPRLPKGLHHGLPVPLGDRGRGWGTRWAWQ